MSTRTSSTSTVLIVILLIFTFPIWIGLAGGLFGLVMGLAGACIGIVAGVFGAVFGAIGAVIGSIFGIFDWNTHGPFSWVGFPHLSGFRLILICAMIFAIVMLSKSRRKSS